jgi:hypothetical protein
MSNGDLGYSAALLVTVLLTLIFAMGVGGHRIGIHAANRLKDISEDLLHALSPESHKSSAERQSFSDVPFASCQKRFIIGR